MTGGERSGGKDGGESNGEGLCGGWLCRAARWDGRVRQVRRHCIQRQAGIGAENPSEAPGVDNGGARYHVPGRCGWAFGFPARPCVLVGKSRAAEQINRVLPLKIACHWSSRINRFEPEAAKQEAEGTQTKNDT